MLPEEFKEECFNNKKRVVYLTSNARYRVRVRIVRKNNGDILLTGDKWSGFAAENFDRNVKWIQFVEEGDDLFYVTGYYENGSEFGGYDGIRERPLRFLTRVSPFAHIGQVLFVLVYFNNKCMYHVCICN